MNRQNEPLLVALDDRPEEVFGDIKRRVLFSPATSGNNYQKMAYLEVAPGAVGTPHIHLGEECLFTISGAASLDFDGVEYIAESGTCLLIPPDRPHPARIISDRPWKAVAVYCDECPALKAARVNGSADYPLNIDLAAWSGVEDDGVITDKNPRLVSLDLSVAPVSNGVRRQTFFSPETTGNSLLKMAYIEAAPDSVRRAHTHLGEESVFTFQGVTVSVIAGRDYHLSPGTAFLVPPDTPHPAHVEGMDNWLAVAAYCDECPVLKKARGKEGVEYPRPA